MEDNSISIDVGYGHVKCMYKSKIAKFQSSICFATDVGNTYGDENIYDFEGDKYYVGKEASDGEAFSTSDYKFLYKFAPLLIYHVLSKFNEVDLKEPIILTSGLAMADWNNRDEFIERLSTIIVNDRTINLKVNLVPQGAGCAMDWVYYNNDSEYPDKLTVVDIGYRTINLANFDSGRPQRKNMKSYPGHGVSSIIKPFTSFMENKFGVTFSEQEAISIFVKGEFKYNGETQDDVAVKISELKSQFVKKMFQSVLVNDKKLLAMSDVVLISGGGAYLLQDVPFPPNVQFSEAPYEFAQVRGFATQNLI